MNRPSAQPATGLLSLVAGLFVLASTAPLSGQADPTGGTSVGGAWAALLDSNLDVRRQAVDYLITKTELSAIPERYVVQLHDTIRELAHSNQNTDQWVAAMALGLGTGIPDDDAVLWLTRMAEDSAAEPATKSLAQLASHSDAAHQALVGLLPSDSGYARIHAIAALHRMQTDEVDTAWTLGHWVVELGKYWEVPAADILGQLELSTGQKQQVLPNLQTLLDRDYLTPTQTITVATTILRIAPESSEAADRLWGLTANQFFSPLDRGDAAAALIGQSPRYHQQAVQLIEQLARGQNFFIGNLHELCVASDGLLDTTLQLSRDSDEWTSSNAIDALTTNAPQTDDPAAVAERLVEIATDSQFEDYVRADAARALGLIATSLPDSSAACIALRKMVAKKLDEPSRLETFHVEAAVSLLQLEPDSDVRAGLLRLLGRSLAGDSTRHALAAARVFDQLDESSRTLIVKHLVDDIVKYSRYEDDSRKSLEDLGPLPLDSVMAILDGQFEQREFRNELRFLAYLAAGGSDSAISLTRWVGSRDAWPESASSDERRSFLAEMQSPWSLADEWPQLQDGLAGRVTEVIGTGDWQRGPDETLLDQWQGRLKKAGFTDRQLVVASRLAALRPPPETIAWKKWLTAIAGTLLLHFCFWMLLISVYPRSRHVQAIFFWNSWVRRIAGFAYVGWMLAWVPPLRRILFSPFRATLLADAAIAELDDNKYFSNLNVWGPEKEIALPIQSAISGLRGRVLLEGESGLGKSLLARRLARDSHRIAVFLSAEKCQRGVIPAIQELLHGPAMDQAYLSTLIYSGSLDVVIDGLNEVDPDTRARIVNFVEKNANCNVLLTSQPIDAAPPAGIRRLVLQPLETSAIEEFLQTQMPAEFSGHEALKFKQRATDFLVRMLSPDLPVDSLQANGRILSNPMDLTLVSGLLAVGQTPDLFHLQQQQYQVMEARYQHTHVGNRFPDSFAETVYQMRMQGSSIIPEQEYAAELNCMHGFKMVLVRHQSDACGNPAPRWYFRHDKIMDFFIVQTFVQNPNRREQHLQDPRFRGVYFLLATMLPLDEAMRLREQLIQYASRSNDTSLLRPFIELLNYRKAA